MKQENQKATHYGKDIMRPFLGGTHKGSRGIWKNFRALQE